ncbi:lytic transglycosylase domain-containing protein [Escherichia coli]|uniref:lytic transglycosylase domain-containing protein n=1 Tax=Escherichia coli TaxID=562 RepID=UPI00288C1D23|nr:lytic transglycosylase domain-containing protein [Escherichia coli]
MAYSREQLMTALRNADAAGDTEGARRIAQILSSSNQPTQNQKQPVEQQDGFMSDLGEAVKETGRGLVQAGVNVANIPASVADAVTSAAAWAGGKLGIGDGTYQPAPRVTTQGLEQDFGLQQGALTPQTTEGRVFAEALPYLTPAGIERAATQAPTLAGRIAQGATRLLAENAVGSLAANSAKDDAEALATDLGVGVLAGGAINAAGRGLGAAYRGVRGAIAPEAQQAIRFAEREGVPLHTTDLLQPTSRVGKMAQTTAENIPLAGTSGMRATQQEARSQLVQRFADKFGEYDPAVVIDSLKAKTSGIRRAAGNRLEQVQNAMAGVNIQPARAIQQIDTEISNLQKLGKVADNETISKLQSYRDELVRNAGPDGPVNLDLKQLSDLRSQFRMDVKGERPVLPNRSDAAIQRVYKAMTDDINGAIGQNLGNDTLRKYQQANAVYADEAAKLKNTRLKNVLMKGDLTPEVVNNMLFSKSKSEIKTLYNSVGRVGRAQMRNGIIGKAMEKSGGSPDQFLRQVNLMSNQTGIAFKGRDAAYLKGMKNYLESTKRAGQARVTTPTGQQAIPFIMGIGSVVNPKVAAIGGGYGLLARMYESEPARNAMLRLANTPRGSTAFEKALSDVERVVNSFAQGAKSEALSE